MQLGREQATVFKLLMRATDNTWPFKGVTSAFSVPHLPGRVFVEAGSVLDVMDSLYLPTPLHASVKLVPSPEILETLLIPQERYLKLQEQGWIRLKKSSMVHATYQNDAALILSVSRSNLIDVLVIPRELEEAEHTNLKKRKKKSRPSQGLISLSKIEAMLQQGATSNDSGLIFFEDSIWTTDGF